MAQPVEMSISITLILILVTAGFSLMAFNNQELMKQYQFNPYVVIKYKEWYRFFTHGALHADFMHLFVNMFVLYFFGQTVELYFKAYFGNMGLFLYPATYILAIAASVIPTFEKHKDDSWYNAVGASGGVSAIMFAYVLFTPVDKICLYFFLCLPGIVWAVAYLGYSAYMGKRGRDNTNHDAHFWGAAFGFLFTLLLKPALFMNFINQIREYVGL